MATTDSAKSLPAKDKFDYQQNYRRFQRHYERRQAANEALKHARGSRIWVVGVVVMLFAMGSEFFLGLAAGIFGVYFWQIISAYLDRVKADESREEVERWFNSKGLVVQDQTLFFRNDQQLTSPVDPLQDAAYQ